MLPPPPYLELALSLTDLAGLAWVWLCPIRCSASLNNYDNIPLDLILNIYLVRYIRQCEQWT